MKHPVAYSEVHVTKILSASPSHPAGRVYAGEIMQLMYDTAHKAAYQHAGTDVTAVRVDEMVFLTPLHVGSAVSCHALLTHVGKTSMEIQVNLYIEGLFETKPALSAYFVMVALSQQQQPTTVPELELITEEEKIRFEAARQRYLQHHNAHA